MITEQKYNKAIEVIKTTANYYKVPIEWTIGKSRKKGNGTMYSRFMSTYILRYHLGINVEDIAEIMNYKSHSSVIHAVKVINSQKRIYMDIQLAEDTIVKEIESKPQFSVDEKPESSFALG